MASEPVSSREVCLGISNVHVAELKECLGTYRKPDIPREEASDGDGLESVTIHLAIR